MARGDDKAPGRRSKEGTCCSEPKDGAPPTSPVRHRRVISVLAKARGNAMGRRPIISGLDMRVVSDKDVVRQETPSPMSMVVYGNLEIRASAGAGVKVPWKVSWKVPEWVRSAMR